MELPPFLACARWLAGFHWASPSTPLDAYCYVRDERYHAACGPHTISVMPTTTDDPLSPRYAEPAALPVRAPLGARARCALTPARSRATSRASRSSRRPGLRWINIERPRPVDQAWLEERYEFHPLDYEDVFSRNQRPKVDEYDDYLFIVLHFPRYDKAVGRLNAAELDLFVGPGLPDHAPERAAAAGRVPVRALPHQRGAARVALLQGPRLPALQDRRRPASTPRSRCCARSATSSSASRRRSSRATRPRSCATSPTSSRRSSTSARSSARSARRSATSSAPRRATSPTTSTSTSTTSTTRPSASGTCSRTTRRSWRRSRTRTSPRSPTAPTRRSAC